MSCVVQWTPSDTCVTRAPQNALEQKLLESRRILKEILVQHPDSSLVPQAIRDIERVEQKIRSLDPDLLAPCDDQQQGSRDSGAGKQESVLESSSQASVERRRMETGRRLESDGNLNVTENYKALDDVASDYARKRQETISRFERGEIGKDEAGKRLKEILAGLGEVRKISAELKKNEQYKALALATPNFYAQKRQEVMARLGRGQISKDEAAERLQEIHANLEQVKGSLAGLTKSLVKQKEQIGQALRALQAGQEAPPQLTENMVQNERDILRFLKYLASYQERQEQQMARQPGSKSSGAAMQESVVASPPQTGKNIKQRGQAARMERKSPQKAQDQRHEKTVVKGLDKTIKPAQQKIEQAPPAAEKNQAAFAERIKKIDKQLEYQFAESRNALKDKEQPTPEKNQAANAERMKKIDKKVEDESAKLENDLKDIERDQAKKKIEQQKESTERLKE